MWLVHKTIFSLNVHGELNHLAGLKYFVCLYLAYVHFQEKYEQIALYRNQKNALRTCQDFMLINADDEVLADGARLLHCSAGDLVLWDSRVVHCNSSAIDPVDMVSWVAINACVSTESRSMCVGFCCVEIDRQRERKRERERERQT